MKFLFSLSAIFFSLSIFAITPSAAQIEQLKNLPRAQQEALAKQYGIDLDSLVPSKGSSTGEYDEERNLPAKKIKQNKNEFNQETKSKGKTFNGANLTNLVDQVKDNGTSIKLTEQGTDKVTPIEEPLKPFGYEIFSGENNGFAPLKNVPVPAGYILGPGDEINLQLYGKEIQSLSVVIDRNGVFITPETGPIPVAGLSFSEFKELYTQQLEQKVIGLKALVTMGELRSIKVFVLGDVMQPGSYTLSSLSTITHAIFSAGGISNVGTLRNVQLKRRGKLVTSLDLYDFLLKGDTANDMNLLPGDVVFVPPSGNVVGVKGAIKRPALYELKGNETALDMFNLAGGGATNAFIKSSKLQRINDNGLSTLIDIDLANKQEANTPLRNADTLVVGSVLEQVENVVVLNGHVNRPGVYGYKEGLKLLDVIGNIKQLKSNPDLEYGLIVREDKLVRTISTVSISLRKAFEQPTSKFNVELTSRDEIWIFSADEPRNIENIIARLKSQATRTNPTQLVEVIGNVELPGEYPLTENMTVQDLIKSAHDIKESTDLNYALIKRVNIEKNITDFEVLSLLENTELQLKSQDKLYIFNINEPREFLIADLIEEINLQTSKENQRLLVSIQGEVRFPGEYPLAEGMTVKQLLAAAGGYTEASYLVDFNLSRFTSNGVDDSKFDLSTEPLTDEITSQFKLKPRDAIFIKRIPDWKQTEVVELKGEFKFPGKYTIKRGETLAQLIQRAGGFTEYAAPKAGVFTREYLKEKEDRILAQAQKELKKQLVTARYNVGQLSGGENDNLEQILDSLESAEAVGRMVVEPEHFTSLESSIELRDGDRLIIPRKSYEVSVLGQVYQPTTLPWTEDMSMKEYVFGAGGFNQIAEDDDTYLIKANGRIVVDSWLGVDIEPGDTVMVPANVQPIPTLTLWQTVTSILAQSATTLALIAAL
ncbi:SLBB domain-containing protein [Psychrosphaera aquimarina]|uniref:SLBB domain-containing protein n=1 Tax=Psychrosphaera aquimarina TaxID=2044854 RepID=A0ABU3R4X2_9GAMM|nr:SLBB domain-containing protein [Psychrosphaera aquimarina]MDU0114554.1 SLBB domain-containing protein [Psychrosphaera aquimarina]